MTFKEKIDLILSEKQIKLWKLSEEAGLGTTLEKAYTENREMRGSTTHKFLQKMGISLNWWQTGAGEIFTGSRKKEGDDILDHPLVKSYVDQIDQLKKLVAVLERENAELRTRK